MKLTMHNYRDENDYWRIRQFLWDVMIANGLRQLSWPVMRLDYWRFFGMINNHPFATLPEIIFLWETPDGQLAAVLNPEDPGSVFMQVHPIEQRHLVLIARIGSAAPIAERPPDAQIQHDRSKKHDERRYQHALIRLQRGKPAPRYGCTHGVVNA